MLTCSDPSIREARLPPLGPEGHVFLAPCKLPKGSSGYNWGGLATSSNLTLEARSVEDESIGGSSCMLTQCVPSPPMRLRLACMHALVIAVHMLSPSWRRSLVMPQAKHIAAG